MPNMRDRDSVENRKRVPFLNWSMSTPKHYQPGCHKQPVQNSSHSTPLHCHPKSGPPKTRTPFLRTLTPQPNAFGLPTPPLPTRQLSTTLTLSHIPWGQNNPSAKHSNSLTKENSIMESYHSRSSTVVELAKIRPS